MKNVLLFIHVYKVGVGLIDRIVEDASFYTEEDVPNYTERNNKISNEISEKIEKEINEALPELGGDLAISVVIVEKNIDKPGDYLVVSFVRQLSKDHPEILENIEIIGKLTPEEKEEFKSTGSAYKQTQDKIKQIREDYPKNHRYKNLIDKIKARVEILTFD